MARVDRPAARRTLPTPVRHSAAWPVPGGIEDRFDPSHVRRPYGHHGEIASRAVDLADHALVPREQSRQGGHRRRIDWEQVAGHVARRADMTAGGRVNAVVVPGCEIERHEPAAVQPRGEAIVGEEILGPVLEALRLDEPPARDPADLSHHSVDGGSGARGVPPPRPDAGTEPAHEEGVDGAVLLERQLGLAGVRAHRARERGENGAPHSAGDRHIGESAGDAGQRALRKPLESGDRDAPEGRAWFGHHQPVS